ncbi:MAG: hypothetical protein AAF922_14960 [Pseudomonadota bacterium]
MSTEPAPLFVGRRDYYLRRMADAARLLPILGVGLFMFPLFWIAPETVSSEIGGPDDRSVRTVAVMVYLFVVWIVLAAVSGLISRKLGDESHMQQSRGLGGERTGG